MSLKRFHFSQLFSGASIQHSSRRRQAVPEERRVAVKQSYHFHTFPLCILKHRMPKSTLPDYTLPADSQTRITLESSGETKLSVAYFTPGWPLATFPNGIVTYAAALADGLLTLGQQPHLLTYNLDRAAADSSHLAVLPLSTQRAANDLWGRLRDAVLARLRPAYAANASFARGVCQGLDTLAHSGGLDLLEMEESFGMAGFLQACVSVPLVVRLHGPWFLNGTVLGVTQDEAFRRRVQAEGETIARAFALTAPSQDVLAQTRQHYQLPLAHAAVIPCPILPTPPEQRWQAQSCEPQLIAFIGRFDRHKGGDLIVDAFAQVLSTFPQARLVFAGPDRGYVDEAGRVWQWAEYVQERLPGALETGQVEWLGQQPPAALAALRRRAQITVVASRYETFSYTTLEALSLGCPLVAARAGGMAEIITADETGLLFQPGKAADLAAQLRRLLAHPEWAAQLGQQAGASCAARFAPAVVAQQSLDFYRATLERWKRR